MSTRNCRDCGNVLEQHARGCQRCAMNLEAESMIDHFIWRRFVPFVVLVAFAFVALVYFFRFK